MILVVTGVELVDNIVDGVKFGLAISVLDEENAVVPVDCTALVKKEGVEGVGEAGVLINADVVLLVVCI